MSCRSPLRALLQDWFFIGVQTVATPAPFIDSILAVQWHWSWGLSQKLSKIDFHSLSLKAFRAESRAAMLGLP